MALSNVVTLAPDVFAHDFVARLPMGAKLPVRMTVVRLPDGSLWVHSPAEPAQGLLEDLGALGPVRHVVAPSCMHHLHFGAFARAYPEAATYGAPGLENKRPDLTFSETLSAAAPSAWGDVLEPIVLEGAPKAGEVVFHHRPSRCLIVTDLVFNVTRPTGLMTNVMLGITGTRGRLAQSRVWGPLVTDRVAFTRSLARIVSLDFDRIVVAHGEVVEHGGKDALRAALRFAPNPAAMAI